MIEADFPLLYRKLGVQPDCRLDEFKRAYRRRVAELHPDRQGTEDTGAQQELGQLIRLYKQALQFHQAHGRLPGGAAGKDGRPFATRTVAEPPASLPSPSRTAAGGDPRHAPRGWLVAGLAALAIGLAWNAGDGLPDGDRNEAGAPAAAPAKAARATRPAHLVVGMAPHDVLVVQGRPTLQSDAIWEYGPSWIRFEDDRVVEWHSSPLYPLKTR